MFSQIKDAFRVGENHLYKSLHTKLSTYLTVSHVSFNFSNTFDIKFVLFCNKNENKKYVNNSFSSRNVNANKICVNLLSSFFLCWVRQWGTESWKNFIQNPNGVLPRFGATQKGAYLTKGFPNIEHSYSLHMGSENWAYVQFSYI